MSAPMRTLGYIDVAAALGIHFGDLNRRSEKVINLIAAVAEALYKVDKSSISD